MNEKSRTQMVQLVDLEAHTFGPLDYKRSDTERGDECYFKLPMDFPAYVRVVRSVDVVVEGRRKSSSEVKSVTLEVDCYTFGQKVYIKHDREKDRLVVILEDAEKREVVRKVQGDHH